MFGPCFFLSQVIISVPNVSENASSMIRLVNKSLLKYKQTL